MKKTFFTLLSLGFAHFTFSQCNIGESEVTIDVQTDNYGYEIYWQLLPTGNACGTGTIFAGGNTAVGCTGGSAQNQTPGGYGNNITITEGPWCITQGTVLDILFIDDWGDNGADFTVYIDGFPMYDFQGGTGANAGTRNTFTVNPPNAWDMKGEKINMDSYVNIGNNTISGTLFNRSTNTITSLDINYNINNGAPVSAPLTGLNILPFTEYSFSHPTAWNASTNGAYTVKAWASNLDGNADMYMNDDTVSKSVTVGPAIPVIVDNYIGITPVLTVIAGSTDGIVVPRDLDFHPVLTRYELWVVRKETEMSGGRTVKISNAGLTGQTELVQQDGNALHFMSLPTAIAFSNNENFATSPGVFDANHDGGNPFTGPSLWSSDPLIYAQPSGGNGSHLDMLHESPYSMGIASETDNIFWVNDGTSNSVTYYDFNVDHGPGNSYHGDAIVRKYTGLGLTEDPAHHVVSHLVRDKNTNWLYIVDSENARIVRMDVTTGTQTGTFTPYETTAESSVYTGYTSEVYVNTGLTEPSGIDVIGNRMIVSDHTTGDIVIYDITGAATELERIVTGTPGIMGVKIGPDGKIWYVNATTNQVVRIDFQADGISETKNQEPAVALYPNPLYENGTLNINTTFTENFTIEIFDLAGNMVFSKMITSQTAELSMENIAAGNYMVKFSSSANNSTVTRKLVVLK
ncbi:MAG: T9SS type A sorting domain-containing protein [Bacteroidota bacterium]